MTSTLTFTDWEHYTDDDSTAFTLDWSSPSAMVGKFAYPYLDALRQAYNERTILYHAPIPPLPMGSPWTRKWTWTILASIRTLTVGHGTHFTEWGSVGYWVDPSLLPTLHNVQYRVSGSLSDAIIDSTYTGLCPIFPGGDETDWLASLDRLLTDAGITDVDFIAWASTNVGVGVTNTQYVPMSGLLWHFRKLLNVLDTLVIPIIDQPTSEDTTTLVATGLSVTGGIAEGRAVYYSDSTSWSTAEAAFNATAWGTTWSEEGPYWSTIGHKGIGDFHYTVINRVRRTESFSFPVMTGAHIEIAQNLYRAEGVTFAPTDFTGLTDYEFDQAWLWAVQETIDTAGSVEDIAFGDYGDATINASGMQMAWLGGDYAVRVDYSGSYFGGTGFIFHA